MARGLVEGAEGEVQLHPHEAHQRPAPLVSGARELSIGVGQHVERPGDIPTADALDGQERLRERRPAGITELREQVEAFPCGGCAGRAGVDHAGGRTTDQRLGL